MANKTNDAEETLPGMIHFKRYEEGSFYFLHNCYQRTVTKELLPKNCNMKNCYSNRTASSAPSAVLLSLLPLKTIERFGNPFSYLKIDNDIGSVVSDGFASAKVLHEVGEFLLQTFQMK